LETVLTRHEQLDQKLATRLAALFSGTGGMGDRPWFFPTCTSPLLVPDEAGFFQTPVDLFRPKPHICSLLL